MHDIGIERLDERFHGLFFVVVFDCAAVILPKTILHWFPPEKQSPLKAAHRPTRDDAQLTEGFNSQRPLVRPRIQFTAYRVPDQRDSAAIFSTRSLCSLHAQRYPNLQARRNPHDPHAPHTAHLLLFTKGCHPRFRQAPHLML